MGKSLAENLIWSLEMKDSVSSGGDPEKSSQSRQYTTRSRTWNQATKAGSRLRREKLGVFPLLPRPVTRASAMPTKLNR